MAGALRTSEVEHFDKMMRAENVHMKAEPGRTSGAQSPLAERLREDAGRFLRFACLAGALASGTAAALEPEDYPGAWDPDPRRLAEEVAAFTEADAGTMPPKGAIVATGSSTIRHWHPRIAEDLEGLTVIPRGFGLSQFSDVIYHAYELILKHEPRAVLLYEGGNDIAHGKSPESLRDDLGFLVELCRSHLPGLRFYVISVKPGIRREALWPEMERANELFKAYSMETEGVVYIDVSSHLLGDSGSPRSEFFQSDGIHLNEAGYEVWAEVIGSVLVDAESAFETWAGYPIVDSVFVDTGAWLGWLRMDSAPWIYSYGLGNWIYLTEDQVRESGAWMYVAPP